jgi:AcrR family transcriptional regulator
MSTDMEVPTRREQMKANRRNQLVQAGVRLIAERGFRGVRLEDLGAAAGISGPAVYRHFPSKEALLVELLVGISRRLLDGGAAVVERANPADALVALIEFHLDFALSEPNLIRIQDRDLENLPAAAKRQVRKAQRQYVEIWVGVLRRLNPTLGEDEARVQAHATFGLINSTPHSASALSPSVALPVLRRMAIAALTAARE